MLPLQAVTIAIAVEVLEVLHRRVVQVILELLLAKRIGILGI